MAALRRERVRAAMASPRELRRLLRRAARWVVERAIPRYRLIALAAENSLCDRARLVGLQRLAREIAHRQIDGHGVECGVYRGGSGAVIADQLLRASPSCEMWLFDVFSGMPEPGPEDPKEAWSDVGRFVSSATIVRNTLQRANIPLDRVHIVVGRYEDSMSHIDKFPIKFLHLDCDWYASVKLCLETFYDWVVPGGAIVFDDYGYWSGCKKAVDEFIQAHSLDICLRKIDSTSHYFVKPV